jgi:hypothetical protein
VIELAGAIKGTKRGQVIYLPKVFRIDEKLEFKSDNSSTMTNNILDPIACSNKKQNNMPDPIALGCFQTKAT